MTLPAARAAVLVSATAGFLLAGCGVFGDEESCLVGAAGCACTSAGACDTGLRCTLGRCQAEMSAACLPPCPAGRTCANGRCLPVDPPEMMMSAVAPVGGACAQHAECGSGICLTSEGTPGGYCSKVCGGQLLAQTGSCPLGAGCVQVNESSSLCLDLCGAGEGECRAGYVCGIAQGTSVCLSRCTSDEDCDDQTACNLGSGLCEARTTARKSRVGEACQADADCASNLCMTEAASNGSFKGGYCIANCSADDDGKPCDGGRGACVGLPRADGTKLHVCMSACAVGVDCRREYTCSADYRPRMLTTAGVCLPRCENFMCAAGTTCDRTVGICVPEGEASAGPALSVLDLGTVAVGTSLTQAAPLQFDVAADAISISIIADAANTQKYIAWARVTDPSGRLIFDMQNPIDSVLKWAPVWPGAAVLVLPNTPRLIPTPGRYSITLAGEAATQARVTVVQKRQAGVVAAGRLPLVFWFARDQDLDAQKARTDAAFQRALAELVATYARVGIEVGPVSYLDLTETADQSFAVIESPQELVSLFAQADRSTEKALHFFAVDEITLGLGGTGTILGISGGRPGPVSLPGVRHSGVAVALAYRDQVHFSDTMAHEAGHFLGLFHLSEREGTSHDPLLDTPECPASADGNGNNLIEVSECNGKGADNLMFWTSGRSRQTYISPDQRFVMLRHPMIQ